MNDYGNDSSWDYYKVPYRSYPSVYNIGEKKLSEC